MVTIKLSSFTNEAASKSKGSLLRKMLEEPLKNGDVISVDFGGIKRFASPFLIIALLL